MGPNECEPGTVAHLALIVIITSLSLPLHMRTLTKITVSQTES